MTRWGWLAALPALVTAGAAFAGGTILLDASGMRAGPDLTVTSSAFKDGGSIPGKFSDYEQSISFPLNWSPGPAGTRSYAVMIQDPDAAMPVPVVHWVVWDIPAATTSLPEAATPSTLPQTRMGTNTKGHVGYFGPHPPQGDAPHHYHVEVFALDTTPDLPAGGRLDDLAKAMEGHVLAHGELVGTFQKMR